MDFKEIKNMTVAELGKKTQEFKKNLFDLRMKNTLGQLSNPIEIRNARKSVARALTALSQKKSSK